MHNPFRFTIALRVAWAASTAYESSAYESSVLHCQTAQTRLTHAYCGPLSDPAVSGIPWRAKIYLRCIIMSDDVVSAVAAWRNLPLANMWPCLYTSMSVPTFCHVLMSVSDAIIGSDGLRRPTPIPCICEPIPPWQLLTESGPPDGRISPRTTPDSNLMGFVQLVEHCQPTEFRDYESGPIEE